ncbi:hypothetical protein Droror1_Dr00005215 [Drosera rotundifolia]
MHSCPPSRKGRTHHRSATSSADAWDLLTKSYANVSSSRIIGLTGQLVGVQRGTRSMTDYMSHVRSLAEELVLIGSLVPAPHLILHTLNGVGPEYRDIVAAVCARDSTISFEELRDKLVENESFPKRDEQRSVGTSLAYPARFNPTRQGQGHRNPHHLSNNNNGSYHLFESSGAPGSNRSGLGRGTGASRVITPRANVAIGPRSPSGMTDLAIPPLKF